MSNSTYYEMRDSDEETEYRPLSEQGVNVATPSQDVPPTKESDDMLSIRGKGIIGLIERIPLWFKLVLMTSVIVIGFFGVAMVVVYFVVDDMAKRTASLAFMNKVTLLNLYVNRLRDERHFVTLYVANSYRENELNLLLTAINKTNIAHEELANGVSLEHSVNKYAFYITDDQQKMLRVRSEILTKIMGAEDAMNYYSDCIDHVSQFIGEESRRALNSGASTPTIVLTMDYIESIYKMGALGTFLLGTNFTDGVSSLEYRELISLDLSRDNQYKVLSFIWPQQTLDHDVSIYVNATALISFKYMNRYFALLQDAKFDQIRGIYNDPDLFYFHANILQGATRSVGAVTLQVYGQAVQKDLLNSQLWLGLTIAAIIVFFVIGFVCNIIFSRNITGPWQRLNQLQETTIRKFVPSGFLRLINCSRISDVDLGKHDDRDITMVLTEIKDFDGLVRDKSPREILQMLNQFLGHVCPIIRKHGGFVEKYNHDGFSALFRDNRSAVRAAMEIQRKEKSFHVEHANVPEIKTEIAIHAAHVLVGTVGENERMDAVVVSNETRFNDHLELINEKLGSTIVTSKQVTKGSDNSRSLGRTVDKHSGEVEIMEVFDPYDTLKKQTKHTFNQAATAFANKEYYKAMPLFSDVVRANDADHVAKVFLQMCKDFIHRCEEQLGRLEDVELLGISSLRTLLEVYCKKEFSSENLDLYKLIEEFRDVKDSQQRRRMAEQMYTDYCDLNGQYAVNITEKTKTQIKNKLNDPNYVVSVDLMDDLRRQMLVNIGDTAKRFKETIGCKETYMAIFSTDMTPL
jgi:class 3 adenylate cyclase